MKHTYENNIWDLKLKNKKINTLKYIRKNVPLNSFVSPSQIFHLCQYLEGKMEKILLGQISY